MSPAEPRPAVIKSPSPPPSSRAAFNPSVRRAVGLCVLLGTSLGCRLAQTPTAPAWFPTLTPAAMTGLPGATGPQGGPPASPSAVQQGGPEAQSASPVPPASPMPALATSPAPAAHTASDGMPLTFIPAGPFLMGASETDAASSPNERPKRPVTLDAFWIDSTEVTNAMYRECVREGICSPPERMDAIDDQGLSLHPVAWVSWADASQYCTWAGRRLPTEAEWEKAARGTDGRLYPWGETAPTGSLVNFADINLAEAWADNEVDDGYRSTAPVGEFPMGASPYGVHDVAGNVWEWVADCYDETYYRNQIDLNPLGPEQSANCRHGVRGGSFLSTARNIRAAFRFGYAPDTTASDLGFRCAMDGDPD